MANGVDVVDVADPADPRLDDFRDLNSIDRRPDLPTGKGLVIAEGVLVVQRMLSSRFAPRGLLGTDRRLAELGADLDGLDAPFYRVTAEVMADVVGFHLNRGVLAAASRAAELTVPQVLDGATTVAVLEGVNDHENLGSVFRNAAGLGVDAVVFGSGCADPLYRRAVRVSMGHALLVPFAKAKDWPNDLDMLRDRKFSRAGDDPRRGGTVVGRRDDRAVGTAGGHPGRRGGTGPARADDAVERPARADPDVAGNRLAQRRHRCGAGLLRAG